MDVSADSLERLVPDDLRADQVTGRETLELHLERYAFAAEHAKPGRVLDLACGVGYGTRLLAQRVESNEIIGVDVSNGAIDYARERYAEPGVEYQVCDAMSFTDPAGFDTIVSLETVEHLAAPAAFLQRLSDLLRPDGVLIASVPITPSVDLNPHHRHDFDDRSFRAMIGGRDLVEFAEFRQVQRVSLLDVLRRSEQRLADIRPNLIAWYARNPAALLRRIRSTLRFGLANHYLTLAWRKL